MYLLSEEAAPTAVFGGGGELKKPLRAAAGAPPSPGSRISSAVGEPSGECVPREMRSRVRLIVGGRSPPRPAGDAAADAAAVDAEEA